MHGSDRCVSLFRGRVTFRLLLGGVGLHQFVAHLFRFGTVFEIPAANPAQVDEGLPLICVGANMGKVVAEKPF